MPEIDATVLTCQNCHDPVFVGATDPLEKAYRCVGCGEVLCAHCKLEDCCCGGDLGPIVQLGDPDITVPR